MKTIYTDNGTDYIIVERRNNQNERTGHLVSISRFKASARLLNDEHILITTDRFDRLIELASWLDSSVHDELLRIRQENS